MFARLDLEAEVAAIVQNVGLSSGCGQPEMPGSDPLGLLRWDDVYGHDQLALAEALMAELEVRGVLAATPTGGIVDLLLQWRRTGLPVAFVSNNNGVAIDAFTEVHGSPFSEIPVFGRPPDAPGLMKPAPFLPSARRYCSASRSRPRCSWGIRSWV